MKSLGIDLADSVYARLVALATARGESVTEFMESAAYRIARVNLDDDEVGVLWALGLTDRQIAYELGWTNMRVATRRRALGLDPHKKAARTLR